MEPGYYLAFVTGGLYSYLSKQMRRYVRPYFLPASSPGAANSLPRWPYPNLAKRVYDIIGWAVVQTGVNYAVAPFFILSFLPSLQTWGRGYWYGHISILFTVLFFHFGGRRYLRSGLPPRDAAKAMRQTDVPSFTVSPPSPPAEPKAPALVDILEEVTEEDEDNDADLEWVRHDLNSISEGGADNGRMFDDILSGFDTPVRPGTPKSKAE